MSNIPPKVGQSGLPAKKTAVPRPTATRTITGARTSTIGVAARTTTAGTTTTTVPSRTTTVPSRTTATASSAATSRVGTIRSLTQAQPVSRISRPYGTLSRTPSQLSQKSQSSQSSVHSSRVTQPVKQQSAQTGLPQEHQQYQDTSPEEFAQASQASQPTQPNKLEQHYVVPQQVAQETRPKETHEKQQQFGPEMKEASTQIDEQPTSASDANPKQEQQKQPSSDCSPNWAELKAKYEADIEALQETAEMATVEKEIAEEKLDSCERELQETRDLLVEATSQIETIKSGKRLVSGDDDDASAEDDGERRAGPDKVATGNLSTVSSDSTATVYQLQKVEEQNEILKQALIKLRDISARDKKSLDDLQMEHAQLLEKCVELEEKHEKHLEQIKVYEEQIDVSSSAHEMVEKLSQEKGDLEDKVRVMRDDLDEMDQLRDVNEQIIENAREAEIELTGENDRLRVQFAELLKAKKDLEDCLTEQERSLGKMCEANRQLHEQVKSLRGQCEQSESLEQQKHQIENVAYKLNFSESKMAEKEAEVARYKRNLASIEEQMSSLSQLTKAQASQIDELRVDNETKLAEISELKRVLKKKLEEVSELEIRKDMIEKKLNGLQADTDTKLTALNRKLEQMKGREIEYEEALKRQEEDIDNMEQERRELREQLTRSNRSTVVAQLERSTQSANVSMMTAQDTSFALNMSFQEGQVGQHQHPAQQQPPSMSFSGQTQLLQVPQIYQHHPLGDSSSQLDDHVLESRLRDLRHAFERVNQRNFELEVKLAAQTLNKRPPLLMDTLAATGGLELSQVQSLEARATKLKREVRRAMINELVYTKSRTCLSRARAERFEETKLALKYQAIESEAHALLSSSSLTRAISASQLLQSTPVK